LGSTKLHRHVYFFIFFWLFLLKKNQKIDVPHGDVPTQALEEIIFLCYDEASFVMNGTTLPYTQGRCR